MAVVVLSLVTVGWWLGRLSNPPSWPNRNSSPPTVTHVSPDDQAVTLLAAGDIASGGNDHDEETAKILDQLPGTVAALGDEAYPSGRDQDFQECYEPTWGRHRSRTRPTPGNHEYVTDRAAGYFRYFNDQAGDPEQGYYSYRLGEWQVFALNSNCQEIGGCDYGSPQQRWLEQALAETKTACALAYSHHPRFSSGLHGDTEEIDPLWRTLQRGGVDVALAGHDHDYERFAPLDEQGQADPETGTRSFVVGTGGRSLYPLRRVQRGSEARDHKTYGVLRLSLEPTGYRWQFMPVAGSTFTDAGTGQCH
ncbi:MAG: metallophosphoesterase [Candidatus Kerfeldbacteria bacterium]|nr:metallophosphoesterase [Candidatus Kerfeldbacteria bacterium]